MKKSFTLPLFTAIAALCSTGIQAIETASVPMGVTGEKIEKPVFKGDARVKTTKAPMRADNIDILAITPLITEVDGQNAYFYKDCSGIYPYATDDGIAFYRYTSRNDAARWVMGNDGKVYIYDILQSANPYSEQTYAGYTVGEFNGDDEIVISFPQTIMSYDSYYFETYIYYNLCVMRQIVITNDDGEESYWYEPADYASVSLVKDSEGAWVLQLPEEEGETFCLGLFQQTPEDSDIYKVYEWGEYVDFDQTYRQLDEEVAVIPYGVPTEEWQYISGYYGFDVTVAFDEDENLYIQGYAQSFIDNVLIAKKNEDGLWSIPQFLFTGMDPYENRFLQVKYAYPNSDGETISLAPEDTEYLLEVDRENKVIRAVDKDLYLVECYAPSEGLTQVIFGFQDLHVKYQDSYAGTPANPFNLEWSTEYADFNEYYSFFFEIPAMTADGNVLLMENLYFRVFEDGEIKVFTADDPVLGCYYGTDNTTLIPFLFSNGWDIYAYIYSNFNLREIGFFSWPDTVGVQSVYIYGDETTESDIMTITTEEAGVATISALTPVNEVYYDMSGRVVSNPGKGIYIKRITFSDGSVKSYKIAQ